MLDLRLPMGMMFALVGTLLAVYGFFTRASEQYTTHSLGINVNLWWGLGLVVFGLAMLALAGWAAAGEKTDKDK